MFGNRRSGKIRENLKGVYENAQTCQAKETGIYHIMVRGINRQDIFHDEDDYQRYLDTLYRVKEE